MNFTSRPLPDKYIPSKEEFIISKMWEEARIGAPHTTGKQVFSMVLPPPNATGELHLGHALMMTIQDTLARRARLQGYETVWVPGTDHAAIATQAKVEKLLPHGVTRHTLGRKNFLEKVSEFVSESQNTIRAQMRVMGASLDWERERYTLGDDESKLVRQVFVKMYKDGLLYRGNRVINWDPQSQSAIADDEVEYISDIGTLYRIRYRADDGSECIVATSLPETKLGDTALAVHPDDTRYTYLHGKELSIDLAGHHLKVKVITDTSIDPSFGSGVLGVTPAHSMVDYDMALRHNLPLIPVFDGKGIMNKNAGKYAGKTIKEAREAFVKDLEDAGLLEGTENYERQIPISQRSGAPILNIPSEQWFVAVNKKFTSAWGEKSLKEIALEVVQSGQIEFVPSRFANVYQHWMENLRDWCISRQIWFGHRVPAWYGPSGEIFVGEEAPKHPPAGGGEWRQDEDTLDTWFSSGMWTFSCFLPPAQNGESFSEWIARGRKGDLGKYHPTSVLETGYDIIFFWVARMILLTTYVMDEVPFRKVYLHGLVRDEKGRKFSKSLGNGIDPRYTAQEYGADATRLALMLGATPGNDIKMSYSKIEGYRNFVTKIFNMTKLAQTWMSNDIPPTVAWTDSWILGEWQRTLVKVNRAMDEWRISEAGQILYDFTWHVVADWYLELAKIPAYKPHPETVEYIFRSLLAALHPYMPFVTERLWQSHPRWASTGLLAVFNPLKQVNWPEEKVSLIACAERDGAFTNFEITKSIIDYIRIARAEKKIPAKETISIIASEESVPIVIRPAIERLARVIWKQEEGQSSQEIVASDCVLTIWWPMATPDAQEREKKEKEIQNIEKYITLTRQRLADNVFISKAPHTVIENIQAKLDEAVKKMEAIKESLEKNK